MQSLPDCGGRKTPVEIGFLLYRNEPQVNGPGDGLNAGYRTERLHGVINVPIDTAFRNFKNLADFKRTFTSGAPGQAFQLSAG